MVAELFIAVVFVFLGYKILCQVLLVWIFQTAGKNIAVNLIAILFDKESLSKAYIYE